ncbi:MAG TPA: acyltransferase family protein [Candidatus Nanopelagicales bacterium]|nr:acyltransferase family protein [Candidatus Nanopelagicales bacterium]
MATAALDTPVSQRSRLSTWTHMPGLDGVRAVAVTAVLVFHANPDWLPGGFLGVDVFFTLSGFLITSLLLAELDRTGAVRFGRFYLRRARRLLPALVLVLIATALLAITVAQDAAQRVREDVIASSVYVTNWWYVAHGTDYFEATGRPPLLQHLWSLSVEEQFYLIWPLLMYGLWRIGKVRGVRYGAALGAIVSTALMTWLAVRDGMPDVSSTARVYFGTDTHAMTLLVGAVLATLWRPQQFGERLTGRGRRAMTAVGTASILALGAIFWFVGSDTAALYRGGFLVVGLVSAGVIAASAVTGTAFATVLGHQPLRWLGERSYGIYLWHWPIFMVLRPGIDLDADGWPVQVARFALTFAAAELSYRFVEMPIRRGALGRAWASWRASGTLRHVLKASVAVVASLAVVIGLGVGLSQAKEPTLQEALGGVTEVGDDLLPTPSPSSTSPTPSVSASASTSTSPSPSPTAPAPHVPPVLAPGVDAFGLPTSAVGDSVMLAGYKALQAEFPKIAVDAAVSRQPGAVYDRIRARLALGKLGDVVIIGAGTNGRIETADLIALLNQLKDRTRVVLITAKADRSWIKGSNASIWAAYKLFKNGNVRVADWQTYSSGHSAWFYSDGIHPKGAGAAAYAALIRDALRS